MARLEEVLIELGEAWMELREMARERGGAALEDQFQGAQNHAHGGLVKGAERKVRSVLLRREPNGEYDVCMAREHARTIRWRYSVHGLAQTHGRVAAPIGGLGVWTRQEQGQEQEQVARPEQQLQVPSLLA